MAIKITLKNSVVQDSVPTTSHLAAVGELALNANINSLGIYMRASDNSIVKMAGPGSVTTPAASTTAAGIAELATSAETTTGTDATRVVTPAGLKAVTDAERTTSNSAYMTSAGGTLSGALTMPNGSNSAPSVNFGDADSGIYGGTNTVSLAAGGTQGLSLDSSANVSIPTSISVGSGANSATQKAAFLGGYTLFENSAGTGNPSITFNNDTDTGLLNPGANILAFNGGGSERARIDASGRLLVGHSSSVDQNAKVQASTTSTDTFAGFKYGANNAPNIIRLGKSRNASVGSNTILQDDDEIGRINFSGADGTDFNDCASIHCFVDGTPSDGTDMPGRLELKTSADGSATPTTRLTITSAGLVNVPDNGKFTAGASDDLQISHNGNHSFIQNNTGHLHILNNVDDDDGGNIIIQAKNGENSIVCNDDGAVELYNDVSKKFETTSTGTTTTGNHFATKFSSANTSSPQAEFNSDVSSNIAGLLLRRSSETDGDYGGLEFHNHPSSNTAYRKGAIYFESDGTGFGRGEMLLCNDTAGDSSNVGVGDVKLKLASSGGVELYYDNSKKLETHTGGITVTGKLNFDSDNYIDCNTTANTLEIFLDGGQVGEFGSASLKLLDNKILKLGTGNDLQIYHDGTVNEIRTTNGHLHIRSEDSIILSKIDSDGGNPEVSAKFLEDGAVELYHDNSKKFETTSAGIEVNDGSAGDSGITAIVKLNGSANNNNDGTELVFQRAGSNTGRIQCQKVNDNNTTDLIFHTRSSNTVSESVRMTPPGVKITSSGASPNNSNWDTNSAVMTSGSYGGGIAMIDGSAGFVQHCAASGTTWELKSGATDATPETHMKATSNGGVEIHYDNVKRLETTSSGTQVSGHFEVNNGELNMTGGPDNKYFDVAHQDHSFFFRRTNATDGNHSTTCTVASNNVWSADFNDTSDEKLKKNIVSIPDGAIANVKQLRPVNFDWKDETAQQGNTGFVAQEVKAILPNLVNGEEWDGTEGKAYSLNTGGVLAHVTKALQEAIAKIEVLETKVAALEGA